MRTLDVLSRVHQGPGYFTGVELAVSRILTSQKPFLNCGGVCVEILTMANPQWILLVPRYNARTLDIISGLLGNPGYFTRTLNIIISGLWIFYQALKINIRILILSH